MLKLHEDELGHLARHFLEEYRLAGEAHDKRIRRWAEYYKRWRQRPADQAAADVGRPNFTVPYVKWNTDGKWADMVHALFGDDAEIKANAVGPSDARKTHAVELFMNWLMFSHMKAETKVIEWLFRVILFGRAVIYRPYVKRYMRTTGGKKVCTYEGPEALPLHPDDFVVPGEKVRSLQEFSWVCRRCWLSPQELLDGEREGRYSGIKERFQKLIELSRVQTERDTTGANTDKVREQEDDAEGVLYNPNQHERGRLLVLEFYGYWRLPKKAGGNPLVDNFKRRNDDESELVIRILEADESVIGVDDLVELYPDMEARRPFEEASLVKDGSYWCPGAGEMLEEIEDELSDLHNLTTEAIEFCIMPMGFYTPGNGFDPKKFRYAPGAMNPTASPESVKFAQARADVSGAIALGQTLGGYGEKLWGVSDSTLGRSPDRPNAPKTYGGQMLLAEAGNVRLSLDMTCFRVDMSMWVGNTWKLESSMGPPNRFFRVTEEEAKGLIDVRQGGSRMTAKERGGSYDFTLKFATSLFSREAEKESALRRYELALQNPLILQNPRALWMVTNEAYKALGQPNFGDYAPIPPDPGLPKTQREEWTLMLQGEDVEVHPNDDDRLHLLEIKRYIQDELAAGEDADQDAVRRGIAHQIAHEQALVQKRLLQTMVTSVIRNVSQTMGGGMNALQQLAGANGVGGGGMPPGGGAPGAPGGMPQLPAAGGMQGGNGVE